MKKGSKAALAALKSGQNVFLSFGTIASPVLYAYLNTCREKNIVFCSPTNRTAFDSSSATLQRTFQIPDGPILPQDIPNNIPPVIEKADIIVIDNISSCRFDHFDYVARILLLLRKKFAYLKPTAFKQLIVLGDFFLRPPSFSCKERTALAKHYGNFGKGYAFQSQMWESMNFVIISLENQTPQTPTLRRLMQQFRLEDPSFFDRLNQIYLKRESKNSTGISFCSDQEMADKLNRKRRYYLHTKENTYPAFFTKGFDSDLPASKYLTLAEGMPVVTLVADLEGRFDKGAFGHIVSLLDNSVTVCFDSAPEIEIRPYLWSMMAYENSSTTPGIEKHVIASFEQLPLAPAYAVSIADAQNMTYHNPIAIHPDRLDPDDLYAALCCITSQKMIRLEKGLTSPNLLVAPELQTFFHKKLQVTESNAHKNAGRKRKYGDGVETCTIRIPKSAKQAVLDFLATNHWE